jgi:hypothetical protein
MTPCAQLCGYKGGEEEEEEEEEGKSIEVQRDWIITIQRN